MGDRVPAWSLQPKRWWKPAVSDKQPLCHGSNAHVHNGVDASTAMITSLITLLAPSAVFTTTATNPSKCRGLLLCRRGPQETSSDVRKRCRRSLLSYAASCIVATSAFGTDSVVFLSGKLMVSQS